MSFLDGNGKYAIFSEGTSNFLLSQFFEAVNYLKVNNAGENISFLVENSVVPVNIEISTSILDVAYLPESNTIFWCPQSGLITPDGEYQTPANALEHEAGHKTEDLYNPSEFEKNNNTNDMIYGTTEERRNINEVETPTSKKLGEGTRENHSGIPYRTIGPTSTLPIIIQNKNWGLFIPFYNY